LPAEHLPSSVSDLSFTQPEHALSTNTPTPAVADQKQLKTRPSSGHQPSPAELSGQVAPFAAPFQLHVVPAQLGHG
jgi:hypothetical protein